MGVGWIVAGGAAVCISAVLFRSRAKTKNLDRLLSRAHLVELAAVTKRSIELARKGSPGVVPTSLQFGVGVKFFDNGEKGHQYDFFFGYRGGRVDLKQAYMRLSWFVTRLLKVNDAEIQIIPGFHFSIFGVRNDPLQFGDIDVAIRELAHAEFDED